MAITAALVKELRERTGLGMMECKKALVETEGDIELAIENLRKSGQAKAAKKAGRTAAEGKVVARVSGECALVLEVNSETDFVALDANFTGFVDKVADIALELKEQDIGKLADATYDEGVTVEAARQALVQKVGENIQVRRIKMIEGDVVGSYTHNDKIAVLVSLSGGSESVAKDVAMHVAAANPLVATPEEISPEELDKEKAIFVAQAAESGKPAEIIEKMVVGRLNKFKAEVSLVEQAFVKNPDITIKSLLKEAGATLNGFVRLEVGEGIEKEEKDFATEVREQAGL